MGRPKKTVKQIEPKPNPLVENGNGYEKEVDELEEQKMLELRSDISSNVSPVADESSYNLPSLPKSKKITIDEADQWFNKVPEQAKDKVIIYAYRTYPVILRPQGMKNIDKIPLKVWSLNNFVHNHGGGSYLLKVNDLDKNLFSVVWEISLTDFPPIINLEELDLTSKDNRGFIESLKGKGILTNEGKINQSVGIGSTSVASDNKLAEALADLAKAAINQGNKPQIHGSDPNVTAITQLLLEKMKQDNPTSGLTGIAELVKSLVPQQQPRQDDSNKVVMEMVLGEIKNLREANSKLTERLLDLQIKPTQTDNSLDQIEKVLSIVDKIKHKTEEEQDNNRPVKQSMLERLIDRGLPMLAPVLQGLMVKGMGLSPEQLAQVQQGQELGNLANGVNGGEVINHQAQPAIAQAAQPSSNELRQLQELIVSYGGMISEKIIAGVTGWEFALDLENLFGKTLWQQIVAYGPDKILEAFKSIPPFWNRVQFKGEENIKNWIMEFIEYQKYNKEDDLDLEDEEDNVE